jgi:hypothetical protein
MLYSWHRIKIDEFLLSKYGWKPHYVNLHQYANIIVWSGSEFRSASITAISTCSVKFTHIPEHQWYQHRCCQSTLSQQIGGPCSRIAALTKLRAAYERSVTRMRRWRRSRRLKLTRRPFHANAVWRRQ